MNVKILFTIIFAIVLMDALIPSANVTTSPDYRSGTCEITPTAILSQDPEYNISSYRDYAVATADVIVSNHMNLTTGVLYHESIANYTEDTVDKTSLASYFWAINALSTAYGMTNNETYKVAMSRLANMMVNLFMDPIYPGYYVNEYSGEEIRQTKRPGVQAYAYWALKTAEATDSSLNFTLQKQSAILCLTDMLYDPVYGGFYYYTMRNGSLNVPAYFDEAYPNDGKRLDHLALAATVLYDAAVDMANATLISMANQAISFMLSYMKYYHEMNFMGLELAVCRNGSSLASVKLGASVANSVETDLNAMAIRALIRAYEINGNTTFLDSATAVFQALVANNWDNNLGGWYTETVDGAPYDPLEDEDAKYYKVAEIQFQMILSLEDLYETTNSTYQIQFAIDTLELVLGHLWEPTTEGFVANGDQNWDVLWSEWQVHYTSVQAQAIISLERIWGYGLPIVTRVRVTPSNPRPQDPVYISVIALDDDGIDTVFVNYSMDVEGNKTDGILPLVANPQISGVYNNTMGTLKDQAQVNFWVYANDTTGRVFVAGSYYFMVRLDVFPPVVELHAIYPTDAVRAGDNVIIDIETYEFPLQSITNSCEMWWRLNLGAYTKENMTPIGVENDGIIWRIALGKFHIDDQIAFFCQATDEAGNVGESRLYELTILGPVVNITPITIYQIAIAGGLIAAPGVGYMYAQRRRGKYRLAQREGKKDAKRRARRRGSSRRR
jgi:hypothetical protein